MPCKRNFHGVKHTKIKEKDFNRKTIENEFKRPKKTKKKREKEPRKEKMNCLKIGQIF